MLQNTRAYSQTSHEGTEPTLDLGVYLQILKRRVLFLLIPFALVLAAGFAVALLLPPIFLSQGRILVESQQIPTELVRPTVTAGAKERIQVIEQRVMTRDNLLTIAEKFQVFGAQSKNLSSTEIFDRMRALAVMQPFELDSARRRDGLTIAVTISFEHERPDIATRVANELVTLVLREDARNRTNRASETTRFLAREVKKHEEELARIDVQIADNKRRPSEQVPEVLIAQLITLKADLAAKSSVFSEKHPDIIRMRQQIESLEKLTARKAETETSVEGLQNQRLALQKGRDAAAERLAAAQLGESLERDQFSERLEVLEQAVMPQKPIRPNRLKLLAGSFAAASLAGLGGVFLAEALDKSIRRRQDLLAFADSGMVVSIPYIATKAETRRRRIRIGMTAVATAGMISVGLVATHFAVRPLDELWTSLIARLLA